MAGVEGSQIAWDIKGLAAEYAGEVFRYPTAWHIQMIENAMLKAANHTLQTVAQDMREEAKKVESRNMSDSEYEDLMR